MDGFLPLEGSVVPRFQASAIGLLRALLCMSVLWPAAAWAQSYEAALLEGITARDRALATSDAADWRQAVVRLDRALSYRVTSEALFERARALAALDRKVEALNDYAAALYSGLPPRAAEHATRFIGEQEPGVGRVLLRGPAGASVSGLTDRPVRLPMARPLFVPAGELELSVVAPAALPWRGALRVVPRQLVTKDIQLAPRKPAPSAAPPVEAPHAAADWGLGARIAGTALMVGGGSSALVTSLLLPGAERDLRAHCLEQSGDRCVRALASERGRAQSAADRIETLRALRWVGVGALLAGAIGLSAGLFVPPSPEGNSAQAATLWLSQTSTASIVGAQGHF